LFCLVTNSGTFPEENESEHRKIPICDPI
jgi:hypothetical protein